MDFFVFLKVILKVSFYLILPGVILFFLFKKKLKIGISVGMILTSLIFGTIATVSVQKNVYSELQRAVNSKNKIETKRYYKIIIQDGPKALKKIKTKDFVYIDFFNSVKKEVIVEYKDVIEKKLNQKEIVFECTKRDLLQNRLIEYKNVLRLAGYGISIGANFFDYKKELEKKVAVYDKNFSELEKKCKKD